MVSIVEHKLSGAEAYLWEYIQQNIQKISDMSIIKLSERANVSTTTIVRTMKKKGYDGYTSFKHHLKEQALNTLNFTNIDQVTCTINLLDTGVIEDAIQKIKNAKRVVIFAHIFSEVVGTEMQTKLQLIGALYHQNDQYAPFSK